MTTYKEAGVDIDAGKEFVNIIEPFVKSTWDKNVKSDLKGFAALYHVGRGIYLVPSTDGVGTKLKIAFAMDKHDTVGIDLVAMCVNDVITTGAKPLFFLDYIACGNIKNNKKALEDVVKGLAKGCNIAGCSLIGGETAEMPGLYAPNEYDLSGFAVGLTDLAGPAVGEERSPIDGHNIKDGDRVIGLASSGLHSNGYSLVRKLFFENLKKNLDDYIDEFGRTLGEELLEPTKIYAKEVMAVKNKVKGIANITGGGFIENIPRILPKGLGIEIEKGTWPVHPIFTYIQEKGEVEEGEMYRTFNMGIGMVFIASKKFKYSDIKKVENLGTKVYEIGRVIDKEGINLI